MSGDGASSACRAAVSIPEKKHMNRAVHTVTVAYTWGSSTLFGAEPLGIVTAAKASAYRLKLSI